MKRSYPFIKKHLWLFSGVMLVSIGLMLGGFSLIGSWWIERNAHVQAQALKSNQPAQTTTPLIIGTPSHISIPNLNIDLPVIPGYYYPSTQSWTLSLDKAQWATVTAKANNKTGDTFIYAHNRLHIFHDLPKVKPGDEAIITTDNGHVFTYKFVNSTVTSPADTSLLKYQGKPVLVLQTCTGLWYQYRQLFVFDLTKAN